MKLILLLLGAGIGLVILFLANPLFSLAMVIVGAFLAILGI